MQHNRLQSISTIHKPHHRYIMYMYSTKETKHLRKQQPIRSNIFLMYIICIYWEASIHKICERMWQFDPGSGVTAWQQCVGSSVVVC